jgi:hypothetical protein
MIDKIASWYSRNRKPIGITVAILAFLTALADFNNGNIAWGTFQLLVAALIVHDVRTIKNEH